MFNYRKKKNQKLFIILSVMTSVSVLCFEIECKFSSVLKINYLSSYTTAIHTSQLLCIILKFKHQNLNWEGKLKLWYKHFSIKQNNQRADRIYQIKTIKVNVVLQTNIRIKSLTFCAHLTKRGMANIHVISSN